LLSDFTFGTSVFNNRKTLDILSYFDIGKTKYFKAIFQIVLTRNGKYGSGSNQEFLLQGININNLLF
jgi:hypothetical protein